MKIKLNLIPNYKRQEIKDSKSFRFAIKQGIEVFVLLTFLAIALLSFQAILKLNYNLVEKDLNFDSKREEFEKIKKYDEEFQRINDSLAKYEKMQEDQIYWSKMLKKIEKIIPQEIILNGIITRNFKIILSGTSSDRDILIKFKESLEKEECFENVNLPLSNLVSRNNLDFQIEFIQKNNCVQNK